jgi:hypothetical protein
LSPVTKANLLVIIVIAIFALGVSNLAISITGSYVSDFINLNNVNLSDNTKMVPVQDDSFNPVNLNVKQPINNTTNDTSTNNTPTNNTPTNDTPINNTHRI